MPLLRDFCRVLLLVLTALAATTASGALRAGAASATIDPAIGAFIAGDARGRRFAGVHDSLRARAVAFADGDAALALVSLDNIGLTRPDVERIRRLAAARVHRLGLGVRLPPERVLVASTHTHSGPDVVGLWGPDTATSGRDPVYVRRLVTTAAAQVAAAVERLQPARLRVGQRPAPLPWVHNVSEPAVLDPALAVMAAVADSGETIATLTNFACHPTVLDGASELVSADWPAGFYARMERALPGEHLLLQGAIGGWIQPEKGDRSHVLARRYGADVAVAALAALRLGRTTPGTPLRFAHRVFEIPLANPRWRELIRAGVLDRDISSGVVTEVAWFALGPVQFATHPGETSPRHALATRAMMDGETEFVIGLGLDALGYILEPHYFRDPDLPHAAYLAATSVGPEAAPRVLGALADIIPGARPRDPVARGRQQ